MIGGLIDPIARSIGIEPNPDDRVPSSDWLNLAGFEQMKFCKVEAGIFIRFVLGTVSSQYLMSNEPLS